MDDLISRKEAIDDLRGKDPSQVWDTADVEVWVNALPSAQGYADTAYIERLSELTFDSGFALGKASAQQWIPCSERLPEESLWTSGGKQFSNSVLMTVYDKSDENTIVDYGHTMDGEWYSETENEYIESIADWRKVIAWMPLPEPWEGEDDD